MFFTFLNIYIYIYIYILSTNNRVLRKRKRKYCLEATKSDPLEGKSMGKVDVESGKGSVDLEAIKKTLKFQIVLKFLILHQIFLWIYYCPITFILCFWEYWDWASYIIYARHGGFTKFRRIGKWCQC